MPKEQKLLETKWPMGNEGGDFMCLNEMEKNCLLDKRKKY